MHSLKYDFNNLRMSRSLRCWICAHKLVMCAHTTVLSVLNAAWRWHHWLLPQTRAVPEFVWQQLLFNFLLFFFGRKAIWPLYSWTNCKHSLFFLLERHGDGVSDLRLCGLGCSTGRRAGARWGHGPALVRSSGLGHPSDGLRPGSEEGAAFRSGALQLGLQRDAPPQSQPTHLRHQTGTV